MYEQETRGLRDAAEILARRARGAETLDEMLLLVLDLRALARGAEELAGTISLERARARRAAYKLAEETGSSRGIGGNMYEQETRALRATAEEIARFARGASGLDEMCELSFRILYIERAARDLRAEIEREIELGRKDSPRRSSPSSR